MRSNKRRKQLSTLKLLNKHFGKEIWWAVMGGWAKEGYLQNPTSHKDIDAIVLKSASIPETPAKVDFLHVERGPDGGIWLPVLPFGLLRAYIPPLGTRTCRITVNGVSFPALRPETLLLLTVGLKPWVPHFGSEPVSKYKITYAELEGVADPQIIKQIREDGFGFWIGRRRVPGFERLIRRCLGSIIEENPR